MTMMQSLLLGDRQGKTAHRRTNDRVLKQDDAKTSHGNILNAPNLELEDSLHSPLVVEVLPLTLHRHATMSSFG
jgi:hypothetical protein